MILSRLYRRACAKCGVPKQEVNKVAKWIEHIEHAGGTVVGIEFLAPHYFSALALTVLAIAFLAVHVGASMWGEG